MDAFDNDPAPQPTTTFAIVPTPASEIEYVYVEVDPSISDDAFEDENVTTGPVVSITNVTGGVTVRPPLPPWRVCDAVTVYVPSASGAPAVTDHEEVRAEVSVWTGSPTADDPL
ncbi:MAG: hypothetical protein ACRDI1_04020 [Actinomycetota bacterium]